MAETTKLNLNGAQKLKIYLMRSIEDEQATQRFMKKILSVKFWMIEID